MILTTEDIFFEHEFRITRIKILSVLCSSCKYIIFEIREIRVQKKCSQQKTSVSSVCLCGEYYTKVSKSN